MKKESRGRGRPSKPEAEKAVVIAVSVPPDLAEFAATLGEGSLSLGVQTALTEARDRRASVARRARKGKDDGKQPQNK